MQSILVGNGLIIQYGGAAYTNSSIIKRALVNIEKRRYPRHLYPKECAQLIKVLHKEYSAILCGKYDNYVVASFEKYALEDFKRRYSSKQAYSIDQIGFEDYFLLFELIHNKQGVGNPDRYNSRAVFRRMFLDSIYHSGKIQRVYEKFPLGLIEFLQQQDHIFTTNYDINLEQASQRDVHYLHGAFHILSEVYNPNSFRNQFSEYLLAGEEVDPNHMHLYSNCLVSYVGDLKSSSMRRADLANIFMDEFASGYEKDSSIRRAIDSWNETDLLTRLKEAVRLKSEKPELEHHQQYPNNKLLEISGRLKIIGLSPNNDRHLFTEILENDNITEIDYYCFDQGEANDAEKLFSGKNILTKDVRELWKSLEDTV